MVVEFLERRFWRILPTVVSRSDGIEQGAETRGADSLADTITATLDHEHVAERAQLIRGRVRTSAGADPTGAFLANGSASGGSWRLSSNS